MKRLRPARSVLFATLATLATGLTPCLPQSRGDEAGKQDARNPAQDDSLATITEEHLLRHVKVLSDDDFEGRRAGSEGGGMAAAYMARQFEELGLEPEGTMGYRQSFRKGGKELVNIIGRLKGSDSKLRRQHVVIGAHFDHLGKRGEKVFNGADDNASGCAALIEVARALSAGKPPRRSILFIGFDGEEVGLLGSRHFLRKPTVSKKSLVAMLNLDMVSRGETGDVRVCGTPSSKLLKRVIEEQAARVELKLHYDKERQWRRLSDHGPFGDAGIPFLYFGVLDHEDYHRPTDTIDRTNGEKLVRITKLVALTLRGIADSDQRPRFKK